MFDGIFVRRNSIYVALSGEGEERSEKEAVLLKNVSLQEGERVDVHLWYVKKVSDYSSDPVHT